MHSGQAVEGSQSPSATSVLLYILLQGCKQDGPSHYGRNVSTPDNDLDGYLLTVQIDGMSGRTLRGVAYSEVVHSSLNQWALDFEARWSILIEWSHLTPIDRIGKPTTNLRKYQNRQGEGRDSTSWART